MSGMLIFVLVLIAALIITLYMVYKKGDSSPAPSPTPSSGGGGPSINVQGIERTLNPDKKDDGTSPSTSGYSIREYSNGSPDDYDLNKLSKNVSMTLQWKNKGGFENVEKIIAKWHHNNTSVATMKKEFTKGDSDNNDATINKYFTNFTYNTLTLTANGDFNAVGTNIIRLYYVLAGTINEVQLTPTQTDSTTFDAWTIGITDLSGTIGMVKPSTYTWTPSRGGMEIEKDMFTKQYQMWPVGGYNAAIKLEGQCTQWENTNNSHTVSMVPVDGANNQVKFILYKHNGEKVSGYVYTDSNENNWLKNGWDAGSNSDQTPSIFEIIDGSKPDHYRFKQNIGGEDHFLIFEKPDTEVSTSNDKFKMMKIDDMGDSCTYNSMDIFMAPMSDTDRTVIDSTIDDRRTAVAEYCRPQ